MKFIVSSSVLLKSLQSISGVQASNNTMPILDNFLFELTDDKLNISSSDLETTMTISVPLSNYDQPGSIAIPSKLLLEILKTFPELPLTFTIDLDTLIVEISTGEGKYKLSGQNAEEFPRIPAIEDATALELNSLTLAQAINKTILATGNDELRPVMSGVFLELSESDLTFVATDAHKLVRYRRTDIGVEDVTSFILPKKPLNQLKNILSTIDVPVKIEYNNVNAFFSFGNINLICRLIDGKFPNYDAVIPTKNDKKLIIDRLALLTTIKRVSIFASQSTRQIRFSATGQEVTITAEDSDLSNEAKERLSCRFEGEDIEIGFNAKFIIEMLANIDTDEICLELSAPNRAVLILPVDSDTKDEDMLTLVMPVML